LIREIVVMAIRAIVYEDYSDQIAEETRRKLDRWNSDQRAWLRRWEKNRPKEARKAVEAEIKRREYKESAHQPIYRKPWRPHFWNIRDYQEWDVRLRLRSGGFIKADRQKGSPVRYPTNIAVSVESVPTTTQRLYERIGRLYKNSCWWSKKGKQRLFDKAEASSEIQKYRLDHLSVGAQLDAPEQDSGQAREGGQVIHLEGSAKRHARLERTKDAFNKQWGSYWGYGGLGKDMRKRGTLNIPRETVETRNNMVEKLDRDFTRTETKVA
jgi:hypothetical protein